MKIHIAFLHFFFESMLECRAKALYAYYINAKLGQCSRSRIASSTENVEKCVVHAERKIKKTKTNKKSTTTTHSFVSIRLVSRYVCMRTNKQKTKNEEETFLILFIFTIELYSFFHRIRVKKPAERKRWNGIKRNSNDFHETNVCVRNRLRPRKKNSGDLIIFCLYSSCRTLVIK